jgi:hypothetical protein
LPRFFKPLTIFTGWILLVAGTGLIAIAWRVEKNFSCDGSIIDQSTSQRSIAKASFIFEKFSKFVLWTDQVGTIYFEMHEPQSLHVYYVYQNTDHLFRLTPIAAPEEFLGGWSIISNRFTVKINDHTVFDGYCKSSS